MNIMNNIKTKKINSAWFSKGFFLLVLLFVVKLTFASHFRYGNISWTRSNSSPNQVTFKVSQAWRITFFYSSTPAVGSVVNTGSLVFGDGANSNINLVLTTVNATDDWMYGEYTVTHTFPSSVTDYTTYFSNCCRIGSLQNNANGNFEVSTIVKGGISASPSTSVNPISNMPIGQTYATMNVGATDPNGSALTYSLTAAGNFGSGTVQPGSASNFFINPTTGVLSFNTAGKTLGQLYNTSITITNSLGVKTMVDYIIKMVDNQPPPVFTYGTGNTPNNGFIYHVAPGDPAVCFPVVSTNPLTSGGSATTVAITAVGLPVGSTFSTQSGTNPGTRNFCWTPTSSNLGTNVITFVTTNNFGVQTTTSVTIINSVNPVFSPSTPGNNSSYCAYPGTAVTPIAITATNQDPLNLVSLSLTSAPLSGMSFSPVLPTSAANPTTTTLNYTPIASDWGVNQVVFKATDQLNNFTNLNYYFVVDRAPVITTTPVLTATVGVPYTYNFNATDDDISLGDEIELENANLPGFLTATDLGDGDVTISGIPTTSGTYSISITMKDSMSHFNSTHCGDVTQNYTLVVASACVPTTSSTSVSICSNALPFSWNGLIFNAAGTQTAHLTNAGGCDSTATLVLTVNTPTTSSTNLTLCSNNLPYLWNGINRNTAGTYTYSTTNAVGCDSVATLNLTILNATTSTTNVSICSGSFPYLWNGINRNVAGIYSYSTTNAIGCDSIATLVLTLANPIASFTYSKNCKNEVTFTNTSTNATDYEWIIGDRTICTTGTIPTQALHSDKMNGTSYTVTLIAKNNSLCYDTTTQIITIYPSAISVFSANSIGCSKVVNFNNFSLFATNYSWDFGVAGITTDVSTLTNPTYTYAANGTYAVTLIGKNTEGCGDTLTKTVVVNSNGIIPIANFTINNISNACTNRYSFTNTSTNAISYQWLFNDGSWVVTTNASKSFAIAGSYEVKLVAQSSTGCFDTIVKTINVIGNSTGTVAAFTVNNSKQCLAKNNFEFSNLSTFMGSGWIPNYNWDFGDGTTDNTNSFIYNKHFATAGIYTIRMIAIGSNGCRDTAYQTIEILPSPIASFTANTMCGMTAQINNQTTGAIANIWNYGDGYFEQNNALAFAHTYHHEDWYFVQLIAIGANGCVDSANVGVFPTKIGAPKPMFTYDTLSCSNAIRFSNLSQGGASASWNFGDGSPISTNFTPTHIYSIAGNYTVTLTLSNGPFCSATYSLLVHAPIGQNIATPKVGMTYNVAACSNTITANDTSLNTYLRNWYLDGVLYSIYPSITINSPTVGGHELKLIVSNGTCYDTLKQFIIIQAVPVSKATHQLSSCSRTVVFNSQATSAHTYTWNFNDAGSLLNNTTEGSLVSHTFSSNGTYYVMLTATSLTGCATSTIDTVVVNAGSNPLNAAFKFNSATCNCVCNNKILFTNLSTGAGNTYLWNFGDGSSSTQENPNKGFAAAGVYTVTLTATSTTGCISVSSMQITILPTAKGPSASFNTDNQVQCLAGNNFSFYNTSGYMGAGWNTKYYWNFGDGTIDSSNTFIFNKHYTSVGNYTVMLVALGSDNCKDTMTMLVQVKNGNCQSYSVPVQVFNPQNYGVFTQASAIANTSVTEHVVTQNEWTLYPNPNAGKFAITSKNISDASQISVIDILGREVSINTTRLNDNNRIELEVSNVKNGYYFIVIKNNDGNSTKIKFNITNE